MFSIIIKIVTIAVLFLLILNFSKFKKASAFTFVLGIITGFLLDDKFSTYMIFAVAITLIYALIKADDEGYLTGSLCIVLGFTLIRCFNSIDIYSYSMYYILKNFYLLLVVKLIYVSLVTMTFCNYKFKLQTLLSWIFGSLALMLLLPALDYREHYKLYWYMRYVNYTAGRIVAGIIIFIVVVFALYIMFSKKTSEETKD